MIHQDDAYQLCFIDDQWAFFTTALLDEQYGDDWNDAPYEHNAGWPYAHNGYDVVQVAWSGDLDKPNTGHVNSSYCVDDINQRKAIPWLRTPKWHAPTMPRVQIWAGTSLPEFIRLIQLAGGDVYRAVPKVAGAIE